MFGTKTYQLSLTRDYVSRWGMVEAVRELIQNALDSDSPFRYEFTQIEGCTELRLWSEFATLTPQTLLLGASSKSSNPDAIGSFGEGYKIAMLVLTRLGYPMWVLNGTVVWTPRFQFNRTFGADLLVVEETSAPEKVPGITFCVGGLSDEDAELIRESCLRMQNDIGQVHSTSMGEILLERPGKLYVGGLFVCETELDYGYNIKPNHIQLERDRQTVSSFDLKIKAEHMWLEAAPPDAIAAMMARNCPDISTLEYSSPAVVKEACYQLFRANYPDHVAAKNQDELREIIATGMERVIVVSERAYYAAITSAPSYKAETRVALETIEARLRRWLGKNRGAMRTEAIVAFKELINEAHAWRRA